MTALDPAPPDQTASDAVEPSRAFVRSLKLEHWPQDSTERRWLCLALDERDETAFARLAGKSPQFLVRKPNWEAARTIIAGHPSQYRKLLLEALSPLREHIGGLVVSRDLLPEVRHVVRVCRKLGMVTVLVPDRPLGHHDVAPWATGKPPWATPSAYSEPNLIADSPATQYVLAYSHAEQCAYLRLGLADEQLVLLSEQHALTPLHPRQGILSSRRFRKLHDARTRKTVECLGNRLRKLEDNPPNAEPDNETDWLFSGMVNKQPRAGLVAYHKHIDRSDAYVPAMLGFRRLFRPATIREAQVADLFAAWGGAEGEQRKLRLARWAQRLQCPFILLEDGLFRSVEIGLSGTPTVSIILDDRGPYYDATRASRLERRLASKQGFTGTERGRANRCIRQIVEHRLSKYNHAPDDPLPFAKGSVLVVDQRYGDLSVTRGLGNEESFREMLLAACRENPERAILVKRHPDALSGGKSSYFSDDMLKSMGALPNVHLLDYEICPHALFDCCEKAYVVTSGMGFEALLRGLEVHCFGVPFYSGWGLTKDQKTVPRRKRRRRLEEIFYATCILHSRYYDPVRQRPCSLEEVIRYLVAAKKTHDAQLASKHSEG